MARILFVQTAAEIARVEALADTIWRRHYTPIIGAEQVAYMLARFQSAEAIAEQLSGGYEYYLQIVDRRDVGYFALHPHRLAGTVFLSKVYVHPDWRRHGLGREQIDYAAARCRELGCRRLWLTVNRHNESALAFYRRLGFVVTADIVQDIGGGFVMDDHRLEKTVAALPPDPAAPP